MSTNPASPPLVILAAGEGSRLQDGRMLPKPLVPLLGRSLAERSLASFHAEGIGEAIVVVGHEGERVRAHFEECAKQVGMELALVEAADWRAGNGASASATRALVRGRRFLLAMVDHLFAPSLLRAVLAAPPPEGEVRLAVDHDRDGIFDLDDLTKVGLEGDRITAIGKDLAVWDAGDTGLFYASDALFAGLERARRQGRHGLSDGVRECIREGRFRAIDVTGSCWIDIDTPEAYREAERRIGTGVIAPAEAKR